MKPTLYLTNWSSRKTAGMFGPGRAFTIMAEPRQDWGQYGAGRVEPLTPSGPMLPLLHLLIADRRAKRPLNPETLATYRGLFEAQAGKACLSPGALAFQPWLALDLSAVVDGDTLCCGCSRPDAAAGECHRVWSAPFLVRAGWRVILDGSEVTE